ncbi:MAG TPA: hypothetical protein VIS31_07730 [Woeseiaceae bacterium]
MKESSMFLVAALLGGCALTDATLEVSHDPESVQTGPLAEAVSVTFVPGALEDARQDQQRIGYKKSGTGVNTANLTTDKPVTDIVMDAIVHAIEANGHTVGDSGVGVSGEVSLFWVDLEQSLWRAEVIGNSVEVVGSVEATLRFTDTASGDLLYERGYKGSYSDKVQIVTNGTYDAAISGAIGNLIDEIVFDEDLAEVLRAR